VRGTMPTCTAQMQTDRTGWCAHKCANVGMCRRANRLMRSSVAPIRSSARGFTLTELIVVLAILSLFLLLAQRNLFGLWRKSSFKAQVQEFVSAMQMAASAAAESGRKYEVIIDLSGQSFLLRQISSSNLAEVLDEEIIVASNFGDNCQVGYVQFDDGDYTNEGLAKFRAGRSGWQYGGKIVLFDANQQPYSVVVNRLNRLVELVEGDAELLVPKAKEDVLF